MTRADMTRAEANSREKPALAGADRPVAGGSFDEKVFKAVMRKLAGTACIIATSSDGASHGLTATAVCSVSAEPPRILVVVNRSSRTHPHIDVKRAFTVNLLAEDQQSIAELFASKTPNQFAAVPHETREDSCPVITGAAAYLHCRVEQQIEFDTHTIFIGEVIDGGVAADKPLVYYDAAFWTLQR